MAELSELMEFARAYGRLGWAIQEQLDDLVNGDTSDLNPNAVEEIKCRLGGKSEELDELLTEYESSLVG